MKVSLKWLKELIDTNLPINELVSKLTDLGLECSSSTVGPSFSDVIIGKIKSVKKHSNSDHLSVCKVNIGSKDFLNIVCGAPNVKENIHVPIAVVGATRKRNVGYSSKYQAKRNHNFDLMDYRLKFDS